MMLEKFLARFGYVPVERADVLDRALGDARAALEVAWAESDRERNLRAAAEDKLAGTHRVVGALLTTIGGARE